MMKRIAPLLLLLFILPCAPAAMAKDDLDDQLQRVERNIEQTRHGIERVRDKTDKAAQALNRLQKQLITTAGDIQSLQNTLQDLDKKTAHLEQQKAENRVALSLLEAQIGSLGSAAYRLQTRPQALVMFQQGSQIDQLRLSSLLHKIVPGIQHRGAEIRAHLERANTLQAQIDDHRQQTDRIRHKLTERETRMRAMVNDRQHILRRGQAWLDQETRRLQQLSSQARSIQELIAGLPSLSGQGGTIPQPTVTQISPTLPSIERETLRLPVSGLVDSGFGDINALGGQSRGMEILGAENAPVVAPFSGIIRYTGDFLSYHGLVIIEHEGGYHSLISGMKEIQVQPGQPIVSGEPIGILEGSESGRSVLYFELRKSGRPIDPRRLL